MGDMKKEHPPFFKSVRNYFREYCNCSSIHGFKYFGEKRTYFERVWWFIIFIITVAGCAVAIHEVYKKWIRSPVIVSFATRETSIYTIPFPAVTICPESKSIQKKYNHTLMLRKFLEDRNITEEEQKKVDYMAMLCSKRREFNYSDSDTFDADDFFREMIDINDYEYFPSTSFLECEFMNKKENCEDLFKPIITDEGICFTFNMLDESEIYNDDIVQYKDLFKSENVPNGNWSLEKGYPKEAELNTYPRRALLAGAENALSVTLITFKENLDRTCTDSVHGFTVLLHIPRRIPRPSQQYIMIPLNQVVVGAIQPSMITTSDSVEKYDPERRKCYFSSERTLKYFKDYTSLNCKLECLTNYTLQRCGCVKFYMPRVNTTEICGMGKWDCMKKAEHILQMGDLQDKLDKSKSNLTEDSNRQHEVPKCNCMPLCSDISYNTEISQSNWEWLDVQRAYDKDGKLPFEEDAVHLSGLSLYFKSSQFVGSERHELYGPTDFLANFGGLLGLFTGFSILSLMEAIYFLTVRLCCNSRLYGYWAGPET